MLDSMFIANSRAQRWYEDSHFNIWKFPALKEAGKRQARPIILNYSIMTRAYGTFYNDDSFIHFFNRHGFDVYLMDWGKDAVFTLSGWTLDKLADALDEKAVRPLLAEYGVDNLNVFGICIGGLIASHLINRELKKDPGYARRFHKIAYYGSPILGARDLGIARTFLKFYQAMKPFRPAFEKTGISLFTLNLMLMHSTSSAMIEWFWQRFWEAGPKTFTEILMLTSDDRWVPFAAFMDILGEAFGSGGAKEKPSFHFDGDVSNIHFYNLVGEHDFLVMPSASIVEWNSEVPGQFASFEQEIFPGGHFVFARPGFTDVKDRLAAWYTDEEPAAVAAA
jgi:pimeloyl-ACP methyl ester carboxylesterase